MDVGSILIWFIGFMLVLSFSFFLQAAIQYSVMAPARELSKKFVRLGTLAGKSKDEIIEVVGLPQARSAVQDGKELLQWQATGYHIALLFKDDICEGISHEFNHRG
jgi:hypothetical protein